MGEACSLLSGRDIQNKIEDLEKDVDMDDGQCLFQDHPEEQPLAASNQDTLAFYAAAIEEANVAQLAEVLGSLDTTAWNRLNDAVMASAQKDVAEVSVVDRRPDVSSDIKQKMVDALKLSAENCTLQSCLEKRSSGNTMETDVMCTEALQAEVVCESEPIAKMSSLSSSHVTTSKEPADHENQISDESEPAPRVVPPYLSHVTTTKEPEPASSKESADHEKNMSDESEPTQSKESADHENKTSDEFEPVPQVVAPYLSHVSTTKEPEPASSKESAGHEKNMSDESEPAQCKESADHENKTSDESEPVPQVAAPYLSHVTTTKEPEPDPSKESTDHEKNLSDESEPTQSKESAGHERKISDEFEPVPRVVAPYLSHMTTLKESAEEPEKAISADLEPAPKEEQGKDISNEPELAPRVAMPSLKQIVASSASTEEIVVESLEDETSVPAVVKSENIPCQLQPSVGTWRLSLRPDKKFAIVRSDQKFAATQKQEIVAESLGDANFVSAVVESEKVPYQLQPSVGTWQLPLRPDQKFAATQQQDILEAERLRKEAEEAEAEAAQKATDEEEKELRLAQEEVETWCKTRGFQHVNAERKTFKSKKFPLHSAVKHQDVKIVRQLIKCGARKDLKDSKGQTPVQLAEKLCNSGNKDGPECFATVAQSILAELR